METTLRTAEAAVARLAELGLTVDIVTEAVRMGELARSTCTANDPPSTPGYLAWARTIRTLRELTRPLGWTRCELRQLSTALSPDGRIAIAVAAGDEHTGDPTATPHTKYPRGPATIAAIEQNQIQTSFTAEGFDEPEDANAEGKGQPITWILLVRREHDEIRFELSLPRAFSGDQVVSWHERIFFNAIPLSGPIVQISGGGPDDDGMTIDVEVSRK